MNRLSRAALMVTIGAIMARLLWTGDFGFFIQQRMRWPLAAATVILLIFGGYEAVAASLAERRDPENASRSAGPGVGWLLALPLLVLFTVAPTALGASAADRVDAYTPTEAQSDFEPLDTAGGPVEMRVFDFLERAVWDDDESLSGVTVRLEGLVVNDPDVTDGFKLTRFMVSCCAADGIPLQVTLHDTGSPLEDDTWVVVDVVWIPPAIPYQDMGGERIIEADVLSLTVVPDAPNDPYESPY